jgi:hypothetical protein
LATVSVTAIHNSETSFILISRDLTVVEKSPRSNHALLPNIQLFTYINAPFAFNIYDVARPACFVPDVTPHRTITNKRKRDKANPEVLFWAFPFEYCDRSNWTMLSKEQFSDLQSGFDNELEADATEADDTEWAMNMPAEDGEMSDSSDYSS